MPFIIRFPILAAKAQCAVCAVGSIRVSEGGCGKCYLLITSQDPVPTRTAQLCLPSYVWLVALRIACLVLLSPPHCGTRSRDRRSRRHRCQQRWRLLLNMAVIFVRSEVVTRLAQGCWLFIVVARGAAAAQAEAAEGSQPTASRTPAPKSSSVSMCIGGCRILLAPAVNCSILLLPWPRRCCCGATAARRNRQRMIQKG